MDVPGCENVFSKIREFIKLQKKNHVEHFFQIFMLNISPIEELLHKPAEIKTNIPGARYRKLRKINYWALSYEILAPEITKMLEIPLLGLLWDFNPMCSSIVFFIILSNSESFSFFLLVKNSFHFKLGFFSDFKYISGGITRKKILRSDYHCTR